MPGIVADALPVADEARRGWRSGQNLPALQAEANFGNRKRAVVLSFCPCQKMHLQQQVHFSSKPTKEAWHVISRKRM